MALPQQELITAMVTTYRADSTLQGLLVGATAPTWNIFDSVPIRQAFPYVVLNAITGNEGTLLTMPYGKAIDLLVQIDVFSQYQGFVESWKIASRIDSLTNQVSFVLADFVQVFTLLSNTLQLVEPDGITRRVLSRYRCMIQGG